MVKVGLHLTVLHLRVFPHLTEIIDRSAWYAGRFECGQPPSTGLLAECDFEDGHQNGSICDSPTVASKPRIGGEIRSPGNSAQTVELSIVPSRNDDVSICRAKNLIRHNILMRVTHPPRRLA